MSVNPWTDECSPAESRLRPSLLPRDGWTLAVHLAQAAWSDEPFDQLTGYLSGLAPAHLLEVTGDRVPGVVDLDPAAGPTRVLPHLVSALRGADAPGPAVLALATTVSGDVSSVPVVPGLRDELGADGHAVLVRDPDTRSAVALTPRRASADVLRWTVRGIADCPEFVTPPGLGEAGERLGAAVSEAATLVAAMARSGGSATGARPEVARSESALPAGVPSRVVDLVDRIDSVDAIVAMAVDLPLVGLAGAEREPVLRRLLSAVDEARRSVVGAAAEHACRGAAERWGGVSPR